MCEKIFDRILCGAVLINILHILTLLFSPERGTTGGDMYGAQRLK